MMRPVTEKEIDSDQDVLDRGAKLWVGRIPFDGKFDSYEQSDPYVLNQLSLPIQNYVIHRETEYVVSFYGLQDHILDGIFENGDVLVNFKV